jgi:hypothetical protein
MSNINAPDINEVEGLHSKRFKTYTRSITNSSAEEIHQSDVDDGLNEITQNNMVFMEDSSIKTI